MRRFLTISGFLLFSGGVFTFAQEVVTGLTSNTILTAAKSTGFNNYSKATVDTLELPFLDDFSYHGPYPDSVRWSDRFVFVNNTFTVDQVTAGVATFDLIGVDGRLNDEAETYVFPADRLTSNPINLSYPQSDSIWFSFLYQPAGTGDAPEPGDSLTLQFWSPETESWHSIWQVEGSSHHQFKDVMIPVTQPIFLKKGFRFRFTAYGSLSQSTSDPAMKTSGDNWNIDYVKLDRLRHYDDTVLHDVAFTLPLRSLLKTHESMPLKHFRQSSLSEMGSFIPVTYRNNDTVIRNVTRQFEIIDLNTCTTTHSFSGGATNTDPLAVVSYNAPLFYTFSTASPDTISYQVKSWLITDDFDPRANDTITYTQNFENIFSFDDGTAEAGYGINGQGARNAMAAYRFRAFVPDSLRAVMISFNDSYLNSNLRAFDLAVWDNNNGIPGNMIYTEEEIMVEQGEGINGFLTYILQEPVYIDNIFYIGWKQRSETFLNAGLDINTPHAGRQFYWLNGEWYQSQVEGSLMIRAVTGPRIPSTGIVDMDYPHGALTLWPNPVREILNVKSDIILPDFASHTIYDLSGRVIMTISNSNTIDVSSLNPGIYILITTSRGVILGRNKFIKAG
ncbi:MAG: T9SS type A sorting domain-containing protein [Bacteroidales bacterium]|nr:T9SS type A sorting domain-containing protein [Bacteroidales bacterium]